MNTETQFIVLLISIGVLILLFLLLREVICWYYKINERLSIQGDLLKCNNDILLILKDFNQVKKNDNNIKIDETKVSPNSESGMPILEELKKYEIFSKDEFQLKVNEYNFNSKIKELSNPIIHSLIKAKDLGIINEFEFEEKKRIIIESIKKELINWDKRKPCLTDIDKVILDGLQEHNKAVLLEKLELMSNLEFAKNNVIVLNENKIKTISLERWESILEQNHTDKFKLLFKLK